jgi:hypothetical protein
MLKQVVYILPLGFKGLKELFVRPTQNIYVFSRIILTINNDYLPSIFFPKENGVSFL